MKARRVRRAFCAGVILYDREQRTSEAAFWLHYSMWFRSPLQAFRFFRDLWMQR